MLLMRSLLMSVRLINSRNYCTPRFPKIKENYNYNKILTNLITKKSKTNNSQSYKHMYNSLLIKKIEKISSK